MIATCKGQKVVEINNYEWLNNANPKATYAFIDKIEFCFEAGEKLILAINDEDSGIKITTKYDFDLENRRIDREFGDKIKVIKHAATALEIWAEAIQNPLLKLDTEATDEGQLSVAVFLDFGDEKRVVFHNQEKGLLVDIHEEDV